MLGVLGAPVTLQLEYTRTKFEYGFPAEWKRPSNAADVLRLVPVLDLDAKMRECTHHQQVSRRRDRAR